MDAVEKAFSQVLEALGEGAPSSGNTQEPVSQDQVSAPQDQVPVPQNQETTTQIQEPAPQEQVSESATLPSPMPAPAPVQKKPSKDWEGRYWDATKHIRTVERENAELRAKVAALEAQQKMLAEMQNKRPMTPEEIEADRQRKIEAINRDPEGFIRSIALQERERAKQEALEEAKRLLEEQKRQLAPVLAQATQAAILRDLSSVFPEVRDPKFRELMHSKENIEAVWSMLPEDIRLDPDGPNRMYNDPMFHRMLYFNAKNIAAKQFAGVASQGAADKSSQANIANGQAAVSEGAKSVSKKSEVDKFKESIVNAGGMSIENALSSFFKT